MRQLLLKEWDRFVNFKLTGELLYQVAFIYLVTISYLQTSTYVDFFAPSTLHRLLFIGLATLAFKIFFLDRHNVWSMFGNIFGFGLLLITWRTSHDFMLVVMGTLILGARGVNFQQIMKLYYLVGLVGLLYIVISAEAGVIRNLVFVRDTTGAVRRALGIIYPTDLAAHVLFLVLADAYLYFKRLNWRRYAVYILVALLVMLTTNARLDTAAILLVIPVTWIGRRAAQGHLVSRLIAGFYWIVPVIGAYGIIIASYFYNIADHRMRKIDHLLSGRLQFGHTAFERYPVTQFGQSIHENGWGAGIKTGIPKQGMIDYFYIDASFLRLLMIFGLAALLVILLIMVKISWQSVQLNDYALASILVIVTVNAVLEQRLVDIAYNPFLIAFLATGTVSMMTKEKDIERVHS